MKIDFLLKMLGKLTYALNQLTVITKIAIQFERKEVGSNTFDPSTTLGSFIDSLII